MHFFPKYNIIKENIIIIYCLWTLGPIQPINIKLKILEKQHIELRVN